MSVSAQTSAVSRIHKRPGVALIGEDHIFEIPGKLIKTTSDMKIWEKSEAYGEYLGFILAVNEAIRGKSNSQGSENASETAIKLVGIIDKMDALIDETPPVQQPQRFGNVAFKQWFLKMRDQSLAFIQEVLPSSLYKASPEICSYLVDAFGNSTRIDYGTGHEISFLMFLCALFKIGCLKDTDKVAAGCYVFPRYLDLARKLQKTYRMEPAGSHGVWSLDDYQFVPFIWGSSQLNGHPIIEPSGFLQSQILHDYGDDYMFLTCIQYINSVKSGPFAEHSNQLWSISGVSSWSKINGGLIKMYKAEVLSKFPVVQHIVFGSLFTLKPMEQCSGLMLPKLTMQPPPVPSQLSFASSKAPSSRSSRSSAPTASNSFEIPSKESLESTEMTPQSEEFVDEEQSPGGSGETVSNVASTLGSMSEDINEELLHNLHDTDTLASADDRESVRFAEIDVHMHEGHPRKSRQQPVFDPLPRM